MDCERKEYITQRPLLTATTLCSLKFVCRGVLILKHSEEKGLVEAQKSSKKHPPKMKDIFVHKYFKGSRTRVFGFHLLVNSWKLNFNWCLHNAMILPPATFPHRAALLTPWIKHWTFTGWYFFFLFDTTQYCYFKWNTCPETTSFIDLAFKALSKEDFRDCAISLFTLGDCFLLIVYNQPQNVVVNILFIVQNQNDS